MDASSGSSNPSWTSRLAKIFEEMNPVEHPDRLGKLVAAGVAYKLYQSYSSISAEQQQIKKTLESRRQIPSFQSKLVEGSENKENQTAIYRSQLYPDKLVKTYYPDVSTLYENFQRGVNLYPLRNCMGYRPFKNGTSGDREDFYAWKSYSEVNRTLTELGSGLLQLGLQKGDFVGIYAINRMEWVETEQACCAYSLVSVSLYDTLGSDSVSYIVNQAGLETVVCTLDKLPNLLSATESSPSCLKRVVIMDSASFPDELSRRANLLHIDLYSFEHVLTLGRDHPHAHIPPQPTDLATICYTSGTTGNPKGVMLLHQNLISTCSSFFMTSIIDFSADDVHISYLPLAHVFERIVQTSIFPNGASIGFYQGEVTKLMEDIALLRPTIFPSVPRLFNRLYDKIMGAIKEGSSLKQSLFQTAYDAKLTLLREHGCVKSPLWDRLVFKKIAAALGGRVRIMITGSAPIAPHVLDFLRICFSSELVEGYGQTETGATVSVTLVGDYEPGHVGPPLPCCEIKLVDVPEMDYTSNDKPFPRGEICSRGPNIFSGYYKMEDKTKEALDEEGWLHSGDIGMWTAKGTLKIIDRKKNIFKLSQGEYIAPEKIENVYSRSSFVMQIFVYGDSLQSFLVGIIVPDPETLLPWASKNGMGSLSLEEVCKQPATQDMLTSELNEMAKVGKLHGFERIKSFAVDPEPFSVDNDCLTPTFKLKRNALKTKYLKTIQDLYAKYSQKARM